MQGHKFLPDKQALRNPFFPVFLINPEQNKRKTTLLLLKYSVGCEEILKNELDKIIFDRQLRELSHFA